MVFKHVCVDSLDRFRKPVVDQVKLATSFLIKQKHLKEDKIKIKYSNYFIQNMVLCDPTTGAHQLIFDQDGSNNTKNIRYFIIRGLGL